MTTPRQQLARLKRLLLARDADSILQGVEFVVALDDRTVWEALLDGVTWSDPGDSGKYGRLWPNLLFRGTRAAQPYHDLALVLLVAHSPLEALKAEITSLKLKTAGLGLTRGKPLLEALARLPRLERLDLSLPDLQGSLEALVPCPALRTLALVVGGELPDLRGLGQIPSLRELRVSAKLRGTAGLGGGSLELLEIYSEVLEDLRELDQVPLRRAALSASARHGLPSGLDLGPLMRCRTLEALELRSYQLEARQLAGCPARRLTVSGTPRGKLPALSALQSLSVHSIEESEPQLGLRELEASGPLPPLATAFPALTHLRLKDLRAPHAAFLEDASLEALTLKNCMVADLSALRKVRVRALQLAGWSSTELPPLPASLQGAPGLLDLSDSPLRSLSGLQHVQGVHHLDISGCWVLTSLRGLEGTAIQVLDARGCRRLADVSALEQMPELRLIALHRSSVRLEQLPERLRSVATLAPQPDMAAALHF